MDDPEFIEYKKYFNETKQRIQNQFQALEDAGFIRMSQSPIPRIGRREPEPEPQQQSSGLDDEDRLPDILDEDGPLEMEIFTSTTLREFDGRNER